VYGRRFVASTLSGPDFSLLARAFGLRGWPVETAGELDDALERSRGVRGPLLLDIRVPAAENVYPMLPPGSALHELLHEPVPAAGAVAGGSPAAALPGARGVRGPVQPAPPAVPA